MDWLLKPNILFDPPKRSLKDPSKIPQSDMANSGTPSLLLTDIGLNVISETFKVVCVSMNII
jgi:hypothetical protein